MPRKLDADGQIGRRLSLRDLHLFFTVVQYGSMAKAASQLGISQPSVSEVIANLEATLGARLLDRRPRGVEPTMYGNALLMRTRVVFDELRQGIKDIECMGDPTSGELRIGCSVTASVTFLRPIIHTFTQDFRGVVLRLAEVPFFNYSGLIERKHDLFLDWFVAPYTSELLGNDVKVDLLFEDTLVVVAGPQSRWARRRTIDLAELATERWILGAPNIGHYLDVMEAFRARGLAMPNIALESHSVSLRAYLLAASDFITAMPKSAASQLAVKILPVDLRVRPWPFAIFTLKNRTLSAAADSFIAHIRNFARQQLSNRQTLRR